ncbi:MAG TPA: MerR family DNA-binding transcriptional regulator [Hyphomicrobiaceae bacterium]|nr:MerR family DNA-binding transcriptional regulator [Hyphomicrobiaceae bacterium]
MPSKPRPARADAASLDPETPDRLYTIGELAAAFGITTRAIRFYESRGLISPPRKGVARAYSRRERARLSLIQRGKNLGFSLEEIGEWLSLYDSDPTQVTQARVLLQRVEGAIDTLTSKRADIDRALKDLKEIRQICSDHLEKAAKAG